jgi:hypothetical protein
MRVVLGLLYLFVPLPFLVVLGHSIPPADLAYPLGMLAARFLAYGAGMFFIARAPEQQQFWITNMILIQALDIAVGVFYLYRNRHRELESLRVTDVQRDAVHHFTHALATSSGSGNDQRQ